MEVRLQSIYAEREFCVTLNRTSGIDPRQVALIYGHALGLKLAGAAVHRHPDADEASAA